MNLLLDTHALLWWLADDERLSERAREVIANPANLVFVSAVSGWEISIKHALGRLEIDFPLLRNEVENNGFEQLNITFEHGLAAGALPPHHRDPFDRMLVAQARCEGLILVSSDRCIAAYDVETVW
ncbi:type II toxin-antitoxin system VapC family toxin [Candidatus Parcubacteria bacterium]|nr:MAG: type II toxin-antitoxin system VapC family toxin [Candidatus Parcubacteria bacterium]